MGKRGRGCPARAALGEAEARGAWSRAAPLYLGHIPGPTVGPAQPLALLFLEEQAEVREERHLGKTREAFRSPQLLRKELRSMVMNHSQILDAVVRCRS